MIVGTLQHELQELVLQCQLLQYEQLVQAGPAVGGAPAVVYQHRGKEETVWWVTLPFSY